MADLSAELAKYGIDYMDAMERMDNEADFYKTLAMKFLNDEHYIDLVAAMDVKDYDKGYEAAHALKGVAGNLSFVELFKEAAAVSDALYQGEYEAAAKFMPRLGELNAQVLEGLEKWQNGELA